MTEEGRAKGLSPEEVLRPANFLSYVRAAVTLLRKAGKRALLPFVLLGVFLAVALSFALNLVDAGDTGTGIAMLYGQLLAFPLVSSLIVPRVSRTMTASLIGNEMSFLEAGRDLRGTGPHAFAGGMIAAFLTLLFTQMLGLLGAFIGWHLAMGPPVFGHVIGIEERSMQDAFSRVRILAKGSALRVFLYLLSAALALVMLETIVSGLVANALASAFAGGVGRVVFVPLSGAVSGFGLAVMCAFGLVAYFDLRTRAEDEDFGLTDLESVGTSPLDEGDDEQS